jgi:hypothetical protein
MGSLAVIDQNLPASVASTFDALAWEMELAGARCLLLDDAIGELMSGLEPEKKAKVLEEMHAVDLLSQQLSALSAFARKVGGQVGEEVAVDIGYALSDITLGSVADRMLSALSGKPQEIFDGADAGELDLF